MRNSTKKVDSILIKSVGKIQKGPSPARKTNPMGFKKNRVLSMKKGEWFIAPRKEQKTWAAAGSIYAKRRNLKWLQKEKALPNQWKR
jgi:hypothetical protein